MPRGQTARRRNHFEYADDGIPVSYTHLDVYKRQVQDSLAGIRTVQSFSNEDIEMCIRDRHEAIDRHKLPHNQIIIDLGVKKTLIAFAEFFRLYIFIGERLDCPCLLYTSTFGSSNDYTHCCG